MWRIRMSKDGNKTEVHERTKSQAVHLIKIREREGWKLEVMERGYWEWFNEEKKGAV